MITLSIRFTSLFIEQMQNLKVFYAEVYARFELCDFVLKQQNFSVNALLTDRIMRQTGSHSMLLNGRLSTTTIYASAIYFDIRQTQILAYLKYLFFKN